MAVVARQDVSAQFGRAASRKVVENTPLFSGQTGQGSPMPPNDVRQF
jgi:hypothetical protein